MTFDSSQDGRSYLSNLRDYLPSTDAISASCSAIGSVIASSVAAAAGGGSGGSGGGADASKSSGPRVVLWKSFEEFEFGADRYLFLVLGLVDGFQIFEVQSNHSCRLIAQHSDAPAMLPSSLASHHHHAAAHSLDSHMLNQMALASTPIGIVKFITHPGNLQRNSDELAAGASAASPTAPYYGTLLAVCSSEDRTNFPRSVVKIFSLAHSTYVHLMRFRSRVFGIHTDPSSSHLVVALETELYVYRTPSSARALDFECVWSTKIMPNPSPHIMAALSQGSNGAGIGGGGGGGVGSGGLGGGAGGALTPLVNLGPNAASILATSSFSRDEWSVLAISKRWIAYCIHEPLLATTSANAAANANGHGYSYNGDRAASSFSSSSASDSSFVHKSPLFQPLNSTSPSVFHSPSSSGGSGGSGGASGGGESLTNVAKGIATGLYNLGGKGKKSLANFLSGDATGGSGGEGIGGSSGGANVVASSSSAQSAGSVLGTVLVRDMETQRVIACIRAHPGKQITNLLFDRSGTLLASVAEDGQYIHVHQVILVPQPLAMAAVHTAAGMTPAAAAAAADLSPQLQSSRRASLTHSNSHSPLLLPLSATGGLPPLSGLSLGSSSSVPAPLYHTRFLYRLFRGITHASIRNLSFSLDSRYLSVVSTKGTTHLYAINPTLGGDPTAATHGPPHNNNAAATNVENSLTQQMVTRLKVLSQQENAIMTGGAASLGGGGGGGGGASGSAAVGASSNGAASHSSGGGGGGDGESGLVGLDSFLYSPKTLSSIYRIKPTAAAGGSDGGGGGSSGVGNASNGHAGHHHHHAPMYTPVIATFARLPLEDVANGNGIGAGNRSAGGSHASSRRGSSDGRPLSDTRAEDSSLHHLLICTPSEQLSVYSLSTAVKPSTSHLQEANHGSRDASPDSEEGASNGSSSDPRAKLTLLVQPIANFDLLPTALSNTHAAAAAVAAAAQQHHSTRAYQQQQYQQPHQQNHLVDESTVRILTRADQQDEQHQALPSRGHSPLSVLSHLRPAGPISFFQELEADKFFGATSTASSNGAGAGGSPHFAAMPRSALSSHSPIFAALSSPSAANGPAPLMASNTNSRDGSPRLSPAQQGASWLSEVELRTYETSDVPIWANPQFLLCSYDAAAVAGGSASSPLYIERLGSKPIAYEKFADFSGLTTNIAQPHEQQKRQQQPAATASSGSASSPAAPASVASALESDISAALSSSMLDDQGFISALRGGSRNGSGSGDEFGRGDRGRGASNGEDQQSSQLFTSGDGLGGDGGGGLGGHLTSAIMDSYGSSDNYPGPGGVPAAMAVAAVPSVSSSSSASPPSVAAAPATSPAPPPRPHSPAPRVSSDSDILGASLPPSSSSSADAPSIPAASPPASSAAAGGKKKKKKTAAAGKPNDNED